MLRFASADWRAGRDRLLRALRARPTGGHRGLSRRRWLVGGLALLVAALIALVTVPVPVLDGILAGVVAQRVASQLTCPGAAGPPAEVVVEKSRLLPQLLRRRFAEIRLSVPDMAVSGVPHAAFAATLRDISQPSADTTHAGSVDASITIGFRDLPAPPDGPAPSYRRGPDGSLVIEVVASPEAAKDVKATVFLKLELRGRTLTSVPQRLRLFGKTLPAAQVASLAGGARSQDLPALPSGLAYRSITPAADGLHMALGGAVTTPLGELPTNVGGRTVSYQIRNGLLGITTTAVDIPPFPKVPVTIFTAPRLDGDTLTLVPRSVDVLGQNRQPDDLLAKLVLSQIKKVDLVRRLPALPAGVRYRSVAANAAGITVAVSGVTVRPFTELGSGDDAADTTFGAQDGLLTATTTGTPKGSASGSPSTITLFSTPAIEGNTLVLAPQRIQMFGTFFPAQDVLAEVKTGDTDHPLQALPANLAYRGVEVLPDGLRIRVSGTDVTLRKGELGATGCDAGSGR